MPAVRRMNSDSGVVTRMCGGVFTICCRSYIGVSPVLTATEWAASANLFSRELCDLAERPLKILWMSLLNALRGDTYTTLFILQRTI